MSWKQIDQLERLQISLVPHAFEQYDLILCESENEDLELGDGKIIVETLARAASLSGNY